MRHLSDRIIKVSILTVKMEKQWQKAPLVPQIIIDKFPEINGIVLQLLYGRGLTEQEDIDAFLNPNYDVHVSDPFLFKDMEKAVARLFEAIEKREKVMVYGDYDADGVCSTVILYSALKSLGLEVDIYIPFRDTEGYGLNKKISQWIVDQKFNLVFTVDCGVSNVEEIDIIMSGGADVIVLDHHQEPLNRPNAFAIINPSLEDSGYPFKKLCGAGVVFKFVQAVILKQEENNSPIKLPVGFDKWMLDLVAIATIGDICPLLGENRVLVKYGLVVLEKMRRPGLKKMIDQINGTYAQKLDSQFIGWRIVPRLNAAGRIKHASASFELLIKDQPEDVIRLADELDANNKVRQQITDKALKEAISQIGDVGPDKKILFAVNENWQSGIVGLVSGRLKDLYGRPALAFTKEGDKFVASGRSIKEFDITAALKKCQDVLVRFGGHAQACGLTIIGEENLEKFKVMLTAIADEQLGDWQPQPVLEIEAEVKLIDINWVLWEDMEKFEPFGEGNPKPRFASYNLKIEQVQAIGNDGKHLKVMVTQDENPNLHKLIGFSFGDWCARLNVGDKIDIVFEFDVNEWNGNRELQLKIIDLKLSEK